MSPLAQIDAEMATEVYQRTERLLQEALDYLLRLPRHPMTAEMASKISEHLVAPTTRIVRARAERLVAAQEVDLYNRGGIASYTAEGLAELAASVGPQTVRLTTPAAAVYLEREALERGEALAFRLFEGLAEGITIELGSRKGWQPASPDSKPTD